MSFSQLKSIRDSEKLCREINKVDIVSFDVFDTLLLRNVLNATDIFRIVELEYKKKFGTSVRFFKERISAEQAARNKSSREDVNLSEIYEQLEAVIGQSEAQKCKAIELELEMKFLIANSDMKKIFDYAIQSQKRVLVLSDMYLSSDNITSFLDNCGYSGQYDLYVSNELNATKATGTLYKWVKDKYSIEDTKKWLHIGDNRASDINNAKKYGINTYYYKRLADRESSYESQSGYSIGYAITSAIQINEGYLNPQTSYWYDFGVSVASTLFYNLTKWLMEQLQNKEHIYFLGRDGYLPFHIYNRLAEKHKHLPKAEYLMASRRAYVYPTLLDRNQDEAIDFLLIYNDHFSQKLMVKDVFSNIGLNVSDYVEKLKSYALFPDSIISEVTTQAVRKMLKDIWQDIIVQLQSEKEALYKYLESKDVFDNTELYVFDIGWAGSTQLALKQLLDKKVVGYYFATHESFKQEVKEDAKSYLFHMGKPLNLRESIIQNVMMYEFLFSAPTESLIKFELDKQDNLKAITKDVEKNEALYEIIAELHTGVMHAIDKFEVYSDYMDGLTAVESIHAFQSLIQQQNSYDLEAFSSLSNSVGVGASGDTQNYVGVFTVEDYLENRKGITREAEGYLWRNALLISTPDERMFNKKDIHLLYQVRREYQWTKLRRVIKLLIKAIKNPKKAIKKAISIVMALVSK